MESKTPPRILRARCTSLREMRGCPSIVCLSKDLYASPSSYFYNVNSLDETLKHLLAVRDFRAKR
jgi:hypothetical protein